MDVKTQPVLGRKPKNKTIQVSNSLEQKILDHEYGIGELLPSQHALAEEYNVSPRCIREAFKTLETKGLIGVSQGRKAIVNSDNLDAIVENLSASMFSQYKLSKKLLQDLLEVRTNLEVSAARNLSRDDKRHITVKHLYQKIEKMEQLVSQMEKDFSQDASNEFKRIDYEFHSLIMQSNNNIILNTIIKNMEPHLLFILMKIDESVPELKRKINDYRYLTDSIDCGNTDLVVALTLTSTTKLNNEFNKMDLPDENHPLS